MYRSSTCERSRTWAALAPDGELSQLERRLLDAHLARCPSCAAFASDVTAVTETLRSAPTAPPAALRPVTVGRQTTWVKRVPLAGKVAAVAAVAIGSFSFGSLSASDVRDSSPLRPVIVDGATAASAQAEPKELRTYRHALLLEESAKTPAERPGVQEM